MPAAKKTPKTPAKPASKPGAAPAPAKARAKAKTASAPAASVQPPVQLPAQVHAALQAATAMPVAHQPGTDLFDYFASNSGRLIFKWMHYFDIYEKHFAPFRGRDIKFLEIGVFHGGSLQMWKNYFGPRAKIVGVDINPVCKTFEEPGIQIEIGSQEDRTFLRELAAKHGPFDIILDDGGHTMGQQIVTFDEMFQHVRRDGLFLCEDLHTSYWKEWGGAYRSPYTFIEYAKQLIDQMHAWHSKDPESFQVTPFTQSAFGMHFYDSLLVIEKRLITPPVSRATGKASF